jgi:uncharacterized heparinase superfamily protein
LNDPTPPQNPLRALLSAAAEEWRSTPFYRIGLRGADPLSVALISEDPRPGDPVLGADLLRGMWRLGAERLSGLHPVPWSEPAPSPYFSARLHAFGWLRDLAQAPGATEAVVRLIDTWVEGFGRWHASAWAPELTAERLLAWLCHGGPALSRGPASSTALQSLGRQARHLMFAAKDIREPSARITAGAALVAASAAGLPEADPLRDQGEEMLLEAEASQILSDGGHQSRSPETLLNALCEMIIAETALTRANNAPSRNLRVAIGRMANMLRFLSLGDGALACFQGGGEGGAAAVAGALAAAGGEARGFDYANQSGYQRLRSGDLTLLMDVARRPPPSAFAGRAHAGALAIEFSCGKDRVFVNVGAGRELDPEWRAAARGTAAHSTLILADSLSSPFSQPRRGRGAAYPTGPNIYATRSQDDTGTWVIGHHDGYREAFNLTATRIIFMDREGRKIIGHDQLGRPLDQKAGRGSRLIPFAVRFHLHPTCRAEPAESRTVLIETTNGARWRFHCDADCRLEESIYLGGSLKPQRTQQIVLSGAALISGDEREKTNRVRWSMARMD